MALALNSKHPSTIASLTFTLILQFHVLDSMTDTTLDRIIFHFTSIKFRQMKASASPGLYEAIRITSKLFPKMWQSVDFQLGSMNVGYASVG